MNFINFFRKIFKLYQKLSVKIYHRIEGTERQIKTFSIFGVINYPLFYIIWLKLSSATYESLLLRSIATTLCLFLLTNKYWPKSLQKFVPVYWYLTLLYCLPFFGTFMFLKNHGSNTWVMNIMLMLFLLILVVDWISFTILLTIGIGLGLICYILTGASLQLNTFNLFGVLSSYLLAIIIGALFSRNKENIQYEKIKAIEVIAANIAHELRTPLRTINAGILGIKKYFPTLIKSYQIASKIDPNLQKIRSDHLKALLTVLNVFQTCIDNSNTFINMLLVKINPNIKSKKLTTCSINDCIDEAMRNYPFSSPNQEKLIKWEQENDFKFIGSKLLIMHVLFNLFKNSFFSIEDIGRGEIFIWTELGDKNNKLYFKDTAKGISEHLMPQLFNRFFTQRLNGTGLGLAFCKMVLTGLGGNIICRSKEGEYAEFMMTFPKIKDNHN